VGKQPVPATGNDGLMAVVIGLAAAKSVRENRPVKLSEMHRGSVTA
jgi:myo-inositol 2-dehydrogenase/D-chiro-inositol 1-dehydrogenase